MNKAPLIYIPTTKPKATLRLMCFPYAGGNSSTYLSWQYHLNTNIELALVQLPGRGVRISEKPYQTMNEMVLALFYSLEQLSDKPFIFFGHSMGARVAYELTLMLYRYNRCLPIHFIASGSDAPLIARTKDLTYHLPENQFIKAIAALGGSTNETYRNDELMKLMLPALRADFKIIETYCNKITLTIPTKISVLAGSNDKHTSNANMESWLNLFTSNTGIHWITGDHFFVDNNKVGVLAALENLFEPYFVKEI